MATPCGPGLCPFGWGGLHGATRVLFPPRCDSLGALQYCIAVARALDGVRPGYGAAAGRGCWTALPAARATRRLRHVLCSDGGPGCRRGGGQRCACSGRLQVSCASAAQQAPDRSPERPPPMAVGCDSLSRLSQSRLSQSRLSQSRLSQSRLSESRLSESRLSESRLSKPRLSKSRLRADIAHAPALACPAAVWPPACFARSSTRKPRHKPAVLGALPRWSTAMHRACVVVRLAHRLAMPSRSL